jgi:hypothetical protein
VDKLAHAVALITGMRYGRMVYSLFYMQQVRLFCAVQINFYAMPQN